jgi:hypothetical protein
VILAGSLDTIARLGVGAVFAAFLFVTLRSRPRTALVLWTTVLCFVPYWVGFRVIGPYFPAVSAVAMLIIVSVGMASWARIRLPDVVFALFLIVVLAAFFIGFIRLVDIFTIIAEWSIGYILARMLGELLDLRRVYSIFGGIVAAAGGLAIIEFVLHRNLFAQIFASVSDSALYQTWAPVQMRGGLLRAEGAFGHSIALGAVCSLAVPLVVGSDLRRGPKIVALIALTGGAVVTLSRIGIIQAPLALGLSIVFLRVGFSPRVRGWLAVAVGVAAAVAAPYISRVFSDAGTEAANSAAYRLDLAALVPAMRLIGTSGLAHISSAGTLTWGGFHSIDSAFILTGLLYGILPLALLVVVYLGAVWTLLRGRANPPVVAVVVQLPALAGVALITQYAIALWFVAGLAVVATARDTAARKAHLAAGRAAAARTAPPRSARRPGAAPPAASPTPSPAALAPLPGETR